MQQQTYFLKIKIGSHNNVGTISAGAQFGKLTVMRLIESDRHRKRVYLCRCACGAETEVRASKLKSGHTKSCGCAKKCSREHVYGAGFAATWAAYRSSKAARNLGWNVTVADFHKITQQPCRYCGEPPAQTSKKSGSNGRPYVYNGIDRIDSERGYVSNNIVACCRQCNFAKRLLPQEQFVTLINLICAHAIH